MEARYRVPKHKVPAEIRTDLGTLRVQLFLSETAERHTGAERPSDLLNGTPSFVPVEEDDGRIAFLRREAALTVTVAQKDELPDAEPFDVVVSELATAERISVLLDDGETLEGSVRYQLPEDRSRIQDFLNDATLFFPLHHEDGQRISFVNKRRVSRVTSRR